MIINKVLIIKNSKLNKTQTIPNNDNAQPAIKNTSRKYDFLFEENPIIKLCKRKNNLTFTSTIKNNEITPNQTRKQEFREELSKQEEKTTNDNHYNEKRKTVFINQKFYLLKNAKSKKITQ